MIPFGEDFKPSLNFRPYQAIIIVAIILFCGLMFIGPLLSGELPGIIILCGMIILLVALIIGLIWVSLYYESVIYHLNKTEMTWKRGVWFKKTGIVPYNRITNVDIVQGPIMRLFHISHLKIQTAGYSGDISSEISLQGIEDPEPLRALIMDFVRGRPSVAAVTGSELSGVSSDNTRQDMAALLAEVTAIRKLLEKK